MFRDEAKLKMKAGNGGDGWVSFRREACVPRGGPDGGDGGKGGDVILVADANYNTLYHLIHQPRFVAQSGEAGFKKNMSGKMGRDLIVRVPVGTLVRDVDKNVLLKDLAREGDRLVVCKGGRGGRGTATTSSGGGGTMSTCRSTTACGFTSRGSMHRRSARSFRNSRSTSTAGTCSTHSSTSRFSRTGRRATCCGTANRSCSSAVSGWSHRSTTPIRGGTSRGSAT